MQKHYFRESGCYCGGSLLKHLKITQIAISLIQDCGLTSTTCTKAKTMQMLAIISTLLIEFCKILLLQMMDFKRVLNQHYNK